MAGEIDALEATPATTDVTEYFTREASKSELEAALREVTKGCCALLNKNPSSSEALSELWSGASEGSRLRACIVEMAGMLAANPRLLPAMLPLLYTALLGSDVAERGLALTAIADLPRGSADVLPDAITDAVIAGLTDPYVLVHSSAADAVSRVRVRERDLAYVLNLLLNIAHIYAPDRLRDGTVRAALRSANHLARNTIYERAASIATLRVIDAMQAHEAIEALDWFSWLHQYPEWIPTAVRALRSDDDVRYRHLGRRHRKTVLRLLAKQPASLVAPHVESLEAVGRSGLPGDNRWAWRVADVLAYLGFHDQAEKLASEVVASIQDTIRNRPIRLNARAVAASYALEAAVARNDSTSRRTILEGWASVLEERKREHEENKDARRSFF